MTASATRSPSARIAAAVLAATLFTFLLVAAQPTQAFAAELSKTGAEAFARVASCAASGDHLLASIVVDESGSLSETDPRNMRRGAVETALDALAQLHTTSGGQLDVQASLATFGNDYIELVGWGSVEGSHSVALKAAAQELPNSHTWTNYEEALRGAQESLNSRASQLNGVSCKVMFWFTDGKLEVPDRTDGIRKEICNPHGLADTVRSDNITVIGLALFTTGGRSGVSDADRKQFKSIVEGTGDGSTCGTVPIAQTASAGVYLNASDASAIRRLFSQAAAMIEGATPGASMSCPGDACPSGLVPIPVDPGIGGFRVVLEHGIAASPPTLTSPSAESTGMDPETTMLSGAELRVTDVDGLMTIDVDFQSGTSNVGTWKLNLDASNATVVDLYYKWGATLQIDAPENLLVGEAGHVAVSPKNRDGTAIDLSEFDDPQLEVTVGGARLVSTVQTSTGWNVSVKIDGADIASSVRVDATVRARTQEHQIELGPITAHAELATRFRPAFPTVSPLQLSLPIISGRQPSSGHLSFIGSPDGPTRACISGQTLEGPEAAGNMSVDIVGSNCIIIPANAHAAIEVRARPEHPADGRAQGTLTVTLYEADGPEELSVSIPMNVTMVRPVNQEVLWYLVALLIAVALGSAWAAAEVMRRTSERFRLTPDARFASIQVAASARGIRRVDGKIPILDAAQDFEPVGSDRAGRIAGFSISGLTFGRSFNKLNPLGEGRPWVESPSEIVTVPGGDQLMLNEAGSRAPVRLPGTVDFVFAASPSTLSDGEVEGRLVVIIDSPTGVASVLQSRLEQVEEAPWDRILEATARAADARRTAAGDSTSPAPSGPTRGAASSGGAGDMRHGDLRVADQQEAPPPPSASSWADGQSLTSPQLPEAKTSSRRQRKRLGKSPATATLAARSDEGTSPLIEPHEVPPSSINFWD